MVIAFKDINLFNFIKVFLVLMDVGKVCVLLIIQTTFIIKAVHIILFIYFTVIVAFV